jgi:2-methylfumaryl-CoA hydratase
VHATPRTVTEGDVSLYTALFGSRFAVQSSSPVCRIRGADRRAGGLRARLPPGVRQDGPDISLNAIANLGYADGRFGAPVFPGDTLRTESTVLGLKPNKDGTTGVVYVRSRGVNQRDEMVVEYVRWVMVRKREAASAPPVQVVPDAAPRSSRPPHCTCRFAFRPAPTISHSPAARTSGRTTPSVSASTTSMA